jgi:hypothetical protein
VSTGIPAGAKPTMQPVYLVKPPAERRGHIDDLKAWIAEPTKEAEAKAAALLKRCGPLVVDRAQYRLNEKGKIDRIAGADIRELRVKEHATVSADPTRGEADDR